MLAAAVPVSVMQVRSEKIKSELDHMVASVKTEVQLMFENSPKTEAANTYNPANENHFLLRHNAGLVPHADEPCRRRFHGSSSSLTEARL